jgi:hypothetical protein
MAVTRVVCTLIMLKETPVQIRGLLSDLRRALKTIHNKGLELFGLFFVPHAAGRAQKQILLVY